MAGEKELIAKKEKVLLEIEKMRQRVDEFNDYGELDMMQQYVQDVRQLQKRLNESQELISWINKVRKELFIKKFLLMYLKRNFYVHTSHSNVFLIFNSQKLIKFHSSTDDHISLIILHYTLQYV